MIFGHSLGSIASSTSMISISQRILLC